MISLQFTYWKGDVFFLGYLNEFPDQWTQGESIEDLKHHLADLYRDVTGGELPGIRRVATLEIEETGGDDSAA